MSNYINRGFLELDESTGPCSECQHTEPLKLSSVAPESGRMLCYDHWHAEREVQQCFVVVRVHPELDDYVWWSTGRLEQEAEEAARGLNENPPEGQLPGTTFKARPGTWGERVGHPGYMKRRVDQMRSDPNFEQWKNAMGDAIKWWV